MDFYHNRRSQLLRGAKADDVDAYLVTRPVNVRYLTGLDATEAVLVSPRGLYAVLPTDGVPTRKLLPAEITPVPREGDAVEPALAEAVRAAGARVVAVEAEHLSVAQFHRLVAAVGKAPLRPLSGRVEDLRATKDPSEVEAIKKAAAVAGRAMLMFRAVMREADTGRELSRQMDQLLLRAGANTPAFPSVVALGELGGEAVLRPDDERPVAEVSKVYVRWGAELGYCAVFTRTFRSPFGTPRLRKTRHERTAYKYDEVGAAVRQAMAAAVAAVRPEATAGDVAKAAHAQLTAAGFATFAPAEVGHGVGLEPREAPFLRPGDKTPLRSGMVLNIAPQVRIPDWGTVQYSHTVVVTREGAIDLGGGPPSDE